MRNKPHFLVLLGCITAILVLLYLGNGFICGKQLTKHVFLDSVAEMRSTDLEDGKSICLKGYYSADDGGGGFYKIRNRYSYDVDDNGAVIMLNNGNVAVLISDKTVNVKQFGAVGNGLTDDTTPIQNAMNYIATKKGGTVYFPEGNYKVTDTLTVNTSYVKIKGYNKSKAILRPTDDLLIGQEKLQAKWVLAAVNKNEELNTKLANCVMQGDKKITVTNACDVAPGMLVYIVGSYLTSPWTSDNRGASMKGETNKVSSVWGSTIYLSKPISNFYSKEEDVNITFVQPLEGIEIRELGVSCSEDLSEDKRQFRGFLVEGCNGAIIDNCYGNGCGSSCFESFKSYETTLSNNIVKNAWAYKPGTVSAYGLGYGLRASSDSLTKIINNEAIECRHCIDISGGVSGSRSYYPSHDVIVANNILKSSVSKYGVMSTHGPAEGVVFENNVAKGPTSLILRGENIKVRNNKLIGRVLNYFGRNNSYENNQIYGSITYRQEDTIEKNNFNIIKNNTFWISTNQIIYLANGFTTKKEIKPFNIANGWVIENNDIILKDSANVKNVYMFNINYSKSQCIDFSNGFVFRNNCVRDYKTGKSYQIKMCSNMKKIKLE